MIHDCDWMLLCHLTFYINICILAKFSVVTYVCLNVKSPKSMCTFCTKICDSIKNYFHHVKNYPCREVGDGYIFEKKWCLCATGNWTYIHSRKTQHFSFTINSGTYLLYLGIFHSESVMLLMLCLVSVKILFSSTFTPWF